MSDSTAERWAAARALYEGAQAGVELLAQAMNVSASGLRLRSRKEGWTTADKQADGLAVRLSAMAERDVRRLEAESQEEGGGKADKDRLDRMNALLRIIERLAEMTGDDMREKQIRKDADVAVVLTRIDRQIIELAKGYARQLGRKESDTR